jgi:UDP-N-acetylmuramyl pentapeptide phosphotransferase/UDP-N-acetylglucosamine-1-phosphate transferase
LLPIVAAQVEPRFVLAGAFLVWPFVFDTAYTFIRRLLRGENVLEPHRSHLYQRLVIAGRPHRYVTRLYILLAISGLMLAIIWIRWPSFSVGIGLGAACLALWGFVRDQELKNAVNLEE